MNTLLKIRYWFEGWPVWPNFRRGFYNGGPRAFLLASECHPFFQCKLRSIDCLEFPPHIYYLWKMYPKHKNLQHRYPKQQLCFMKYLFQCSMYRIQTSSLWAALVVHSWPGCFAVRYARHASPVSNLRALPTCRWDGTLDKSLPLSRHHSTISTDSSKPFWKEVARLLWWIEGWRRILVVYGGFPVVDAFPVWGPWGWGPAIASSPWILATQGVLNCRTT